jgi:hypothetical protein
MLNIIITCPHCTNIIIIEQLNCHIFRHGVFKLDGKQISPHTPKELCDLYVKHENEYIAQICDYV